MIWKIARKEFKEIWRDGRFRFVGAIVSLLLLATLLIGWQHYRQISAERNTARQFDEQQWLAQGERNPHTAAHFGKYAFKPQTPVSFLDNGVNSYLGVAIWLEAHYQNPFRFRPVEDATVVQRFGELTAAVVLQLLIPLLIILLTFSTFAGERESGTLRQLLSLGVDRKILGLGKAMGVSGALLILLIPAAIIGVAALALAATGTSGDGLAASAGRFAVMVAAYSLYFIAILAVSLAGSAHFKTARTAMLVLFAFWIFNGLLAPRAIADSAQTAYRAPSQNEFWDNVRRDKSEGIDGHNPQDDRTEEVKKQLLVQFKVEKTEDLPINYAGWYMLQDEEYGNRVFDKRYGELWGIYERQNRINDFGTLLAPLLGVRSISMSMAGTDFAHHRHFAAEAEEFRRVLNKALNEDLMINGVGKNDWDSGANRENYIADEKLWKNSPQFRYELPSTGWALTTQILPLALLALWASVASGLAWFAIGRMRLE